MKSLQFELSMQNKDTDGLQKQTLDAENEHSDDSMLSGEKKEFLRVHLESTYYVVNLFLKVCLPQLRNILLNWDETLFNAFQTLFLTMLGLAKYLKTEL